MFKNEFATLCNAGKAKADFLEKNKVGYFVSALMAGLFIAFGGFITFTWGANLTINGLPVPGNKRCGIPRSHKRKQGDAADQHTPSYDCKRTVLIHQITRKQVIEYRCHC